MYESGHFSESSLREFQPEAWFSMGMLTGFLHSPESGESVGGGDDLIILACGEGESKEGEGSICRLLGD